MRRTRADAGVSLAADSCNEPVRGAILLQIGSTLGPAADCKFREPAQPILIAVYCSEEGMGLLFDPRQHVIAVTFAVQVRGTIVAMGGDPGL